MITQRFEVNDKDFTIGIGRTLYFGRGRYKNGFWLCFYSHSPCGRVNDQERGWVVVDLEKKEIVDTLETYSWISMNSKGTYNKWYREQIEKYGKLKPFRNYNGEYYWKMGE